MNVLVTQEQVNMLEKLIGKLESHHIEISALSKKAPNDAVNKFKIKFLNTVLTECNKFLGDDYRAVEDFEQFDVDSVPSNSDVTFILSLYLQAVEKFRSDHIEPIGVFWVYRMSSKDKIRTGPPAKLRK